MTRHVLRAQQFEREWLTQLFERAAQLQADLAKPGGRDQLTKLAANQLLFNVFYEPSTRTRMSFAAAAGHLGMQVVGTENAREFSSAAKGETLEDSIRVLAEYRPDAIVLRHFEVGSAERAAAVSPVPIINAGDGAGQHPTQALLDLYTIFHERGRLDDLTVVIGGDLANGRTARSLIYLLSKFQNNRLVLVSPTTLRIGDDIKQHLAEHTIPFEESDQLEPHVSKADVVYWTRVQRERFADAAAYKEVKDQFILGPEHLKQLSSEAVIMHPLPRVGEISAEVDADPRAAYFRQAGNGMAVRMALLEWVLAS